MDFLANYGLFLLKVLTLLFALLLAVAGILALSRKQKHVLEITSLNKQYEKLKHRMMHEIKKRSCLRKKRKKKRQTISLCS